MGDIFSPRIRLEDLDDTGPAGPYPHELDDIGLKRLCLEIMRMAVWDTQKSPKNADQARVWLASTGVVWLKAMGVSMGLSRHFTDEKLKDLFYGTCQQPELGLNEEESDWEDRQ